MKIQLQPGTYVIAVSGGVDSMVLLHALAQGYKGVPGYLFTVAHFDHGIREDSAQDRRLVQGAAHAYGLPFVYDEAHLGANTSEAAARLARYAFLRKVQDAIGARAIVTAHHQDDVLETAVLNLMRGTNRRGLSSLRSTNDIVRPFLHIPKEYLRQYAAEHGIAWREDSTNSDTKYLRNRVRHTVLSGMDHETREYFVRLLDNIRATNAELDAELENYIKSSHAGNVLDRQQFVSLPQPVAKEVLATWLRANGITDYDRKTLARLVDAAAAFRPGSLANVTGGYFLRVRKDILALEHHDR